MGEYLDPGFTPARKITIACPSCDREITIFASHSPEIMKVVCDNCEEPFGYGEWDDV